MINHRINIAFKRRWADIVVVAPASANMIANIASGQSNSLALCVLRAWDFAASPCILCPAMNSVMWEHPVTSSSLQILGGWGYRVISPISKTLACNEIGKGALASVSTIVTQIKQICDDLPHSNQHKTINIDFPIHNRGKERLLFNILGLIFGFIVIKTTLK